MNYIKHLAQRKGLLRLAVIVVLGLLILGVIAVTPAAAIYRYDENGQELQGLEEVQGEQQPALLETKAGTFDAAGDEQAADQTGGNTEEVAPAADATVGSTAASRTGSGQQVFLWAGLAAVSVSLVLVLKHRAQTGQQSS